MFWSVYAYLGKECKDFSQNTQWLHILRYLILFTVILVTEGWKQQRPAITDFYQYFPASYNITELMTLKEHVMMSF